MLEKIRSVVRRFFNEPENYGPVRVQPVPRGTFTYYKVDCLLCVVRHPVFTRLDRAADFAKRHAAEHESFIIYIDNRPPAE